MTIKELRKAKGLSQTSVANTLQLSLSTYRYWEDDPSFIRVRDLKTLAILFDVAIIEVVCAVLGE